ncbi:MAG: hypothetical protein LBK06_07735 [Planctomycetaceae bacterium]|jgi:flagellar motor switch protein FliG|nr:hypothetical protein [Planctomycetaceae bacterium]
MNGIKKSAKFLSGLDRNTMTQLLGCLDSDTAKLLRREIISVGNVSLEESDKLANEFFKAAGGKYRQNGNRRVAGAFEISSGVYELPTDSRVANKFTNSAEAVLKSEELNTQAQQRGAVVQGRSLPPIPAPVSLNTDNHSAHFPTSGNYAPRFDINQNNTRQPAQFADQHTHHSYQTTYPQYHSTVQNHETDRKLPFEFLFDEPPVKIADAICREHPQTIAVVIAGLPDLLAEETLSVLPPSLQKEVGRRLAEIKLSGFDFAGNPVLFEIESELKQRFSKRRGISFDDLDRLDDVMLIDLFRSVEMRTAMCALVGAKPRFIERITSKFTPTEEFLMRKLLKESGKIDEKEVENARSILVKHATDFFSNSSNVNFGLAR